MSKNKTRTKDKYRVVYNDTQRIELENEFRLNQYIAIPRKQEIAQKLQLSERQIKIWFQNRRAKKRKQDKRRQGVSSATINTTTTTTTSLTSDHPLTPRTSCTTNSSSDSSSLSLNIFMAANQPMNHYSPHINSMHHESIVGMQSSMDPSTNYQMHPQQTSQQQQDQPPPPQLPQQTQLHQQQFTIKQETQPQQQQQLNQQQSLHNTQLQQQTQQQQQAYLQQQQHNQQHQQSPHSLPPMYAQSNSYMDMVPAQNVPSSLHPNMQQASHQQSHYSQQYSPPPYWNSTPMHNQPYYGPPSGSQAPVQCYNA